MKKCLLESTNRYLKQADWTDLALIKVCVCAAGLLLGLGVKKHKKPLAIFSLGVFFGTLAASMRRFLPFLSESGDCACETRVSQEPSPVPQSEN